MFKSIQYKLILFICILIVSVAALTCCIIYQQYALAIISGITVLISLHSLQRHYKKFNSNILFLLNALDNGDYSFHFSENNLSRREKELNSMLNRIKEILTNARKEVIENEKFLSLIIESVSTGIIILDDFGHVQTVNRSALHLLGLPVFTHINQLSGVNENFPELFRTMKAGDHQQLSVTNEREEMQVSLRLSEIKLKNGRMKVITLSNIGNELETKEMESWIRLIRVMTHEIMNSIAPITSLSETLLSLHKNPVAGESDETLKSNTIEAFETIHTTARGLLSFVDSYRKFTGIPKPVVQAFPLKPFLEKVLHLERKVLKEKNIHLQLIFDDAGIELLADEKLMMQVLVNLMKNAIEAIVSTENGQIIIHTHKRTAGQVAIDICNTGKPILQDVLPNIFIPFFTTKETGTGIGLSVSRYIMRLHGGKLIHSTSPEGWTVFTLIC